LLTKFAPFWFVVNRFLVSVWLLTGSSNGGEGEYRGEQLRAHRHHRWWGDLFPLFAVMLLELPLIIEHLVNPEH
jgi:hypothetical protein